MRKTFHISIGNFNLYKYESRQFSCLTCEKHRYEWPDIHVDYMITRSADHGNTAVAYFIRAFKWARHINESKTCEDLAPLLDQPTLLLANSLYRGFSSIQTACQSHTFSDEEFPELGEWSRPD